VMTQAVFGNSQNINTTWVMKLYTLLRIAEVRKNTCTGHTWDMKLHISGNIACKIVVPLLFKFPRAVWRVMIFGPQLQTQLVGQLSIIPGYSKSPAVLPSQHIWSFVISHLCYLKYFKTSDFANTSGWNALNLCSFSSSNEFI
jgi:hypothetical protein